MRLTLSEVILLQFIDKCEFHPYQIQKNFTHYCVCLCGCARAHAQDHCTYEWRPETSMAVIPQGCLSSFLRHRHMPGTSWLVSPSLFLGLQLYPNDLLDFPRGLGIKLGLLHFQSKNSTNWAVSPAPQPSLCRMSLLPVFSLLPLKDHLLRISGHSRTQVSLSILTPYLLVIILSSGSFSSLQWPLPGVSKIQIPHSSLRVSIGAIFAVSISSLRYLFIHSPWPLCTLNHAAHWTELCRSPGLLSHIQATQHHFSYRFLSAAWGEFCPVPAPEQCGAGVYFRGRLTLPRVVTFITCSFFFSVSVCVHACVCMCIWRPEVDVT